MLYRFALGLSVFLLSGTAAAEDRFELGGYVGYLFGGSVEGESGSSRSSADIDSATSYGGFVDVALRRNAFVELSYTRQPTELQLHRTDVLDATSTDYRYDILVQYFQLGGLLEFRTPTVDWLRPVFGGTFGATVFTANDDRASYEEWRASLILEAGLKIRLTHFLGLRARARGFVTFLTDDSALFCAGGAGCAYAFTGTAMLQGEVGGGAYLSF